MFYVHQCCVYWVNHIGLVVWLSGDVVGHINQVTLRRAGLTLRWVTVSGYTVLVFIETTQVNLAWSSLRG